jgi:Cys-rich protein (TIGR01571 family)
MIRVVAPSNLPEDYKLDIETTEGQIITVTIPLGGVKENEIFLVAKPDAYEGEELLDAPRGHWKDGLFDCFKYGFCHSHLWFALLCRECALGQIMQRMRLDWLGNMTMNSNYTFRTVCIITICFVIYKTSLDMYIAFHIDDHGYYDYNDIQNVYLYARNVVSVLFTVWLTVSLYKTRKNVRKQFSIPEDKRYRGWEDCLCSTFCSFCTSKSVFLLFNN